VNLSHLYKRDFQVEFAQVIFKKKIVNNIIILIIVLFKNILKKK
jgi:hypothetical protein